MSRRIKLGPFNRVEGDLEVQLDVADGVVQAAFVNSPLFRGFEWLLRGRPASDALVYAPRICGICSVSQSVAAASALAQATGVTPPPSGQWAINLKLACENTADHLTHFYLFFMPDFASEAYVQRPWHETAARRFMPMKGEVLPQVLQARAQWLHILGLLGGHWPHTLAIQPGGATRVLDRAQCLRLETMIRAFEHFLQQRLTGGVPLEKVLMARTLDELRERLGDGDMALFLTLCDDLNLWQLGRTPTNLMSYGNYPTPEGGRVFPSGIWQAGVRRTLNTQQITEDVSHARYQGQAGAPWQQRLQPDVNKPGAYSLCKAPRLDGEVFECGALARQLMAEEPLMEALVRTYGSSVATRVLGRLWELMRLPGLMRQWVAQLQPDADWNRPYDASGSGHGLGLVEAARGSLLHWLEMDKGIIQHYEIIAPTTWNFSPRDATGQPGPLEQALTGIEVGEAVERHPAVQHIVRSFDPCMVCTVH